MKRLLLLGITSLLCIYPALSATLIVSGNGLVNASPDVAFVTLGVDVLKPTASEAQAENTRSMSSLISALQKAGLKKDDLQTSNYSIYEEKRYDGGAPRTVGFRCSNQVRATVADIAKVGKIIDAGISAGANTVHGISFDIKDDAEYKKEALKQAYEAAHQKALALAQAAGQKIVKISRIIESGAQVMPQPMDNMRLMSMAKAEAAPTPVMTGQLDVRGDVTVEYEIN